MKELRYLAGVEENELKSFAMTKGQKAAPKTKKEKKADKRATLKAKIEARNGIRDDDDSIVKESKPQPKTSKSSSGDVENMARQTFTKGWMDSFSVKDSLPIKQKGKVVRTVNQIKEEKGNPNPNPNSNTNTNPIYNHDTNHNTTLTPNPTLTPTLTLTKEENSDEENGSDAEVVFEDGFRAVKYADPVTTAESDDEGDYEFVPDLEMDRADEIVSTSMLSTQKRETPSHLEKKTPGDKDSQRAKKANSVSKFLSGITMYNARNIIGDICTSVTADPEKSFRKKRDTGDDEAPTYNFSDLLSILFHPDLQIVELAMLSCLLAFKDVLPGYRIRPASEQEKDVILKKETKRLRDYENAILGAYQRYLKFLSDKATLGLKNPKKGVSNWDIESKLGLSALRCQVRVRVRIKIINGIMI
jgi:hypothetical protein